MYSNETKTGLKVSTIICTYNRREWVNNLLSSISKQSIFPEEIFIVDATERTIEYSFPESLNISIIRSDKRALTYQKNLGLNKATGDIIFFLDDDIILDECYIEQTLAVFKDDTEEKIGAVSGYITNQWGKIRNFPGWQMKLAKKLKIYDGDFKPGSVSPSGIFVELSALSPFTGVHSVDFVPGGCTAVRSKVFKKYRPPLEITRYGGEDKCFSRMIAKDWTLCVCGDAKLQHFSAPGGPRPSDFSGTKSTARIHLYIQKKFGKTEGKLTRLRLYFIYNTLIIAVVGLLQIVRPSRGINSTRRLFKRAIGYLAGACGRV